MTTQTIEEVVDEIGKLKEEIKPIKEQLSEKHDKMHELVMKKINLQREQNKGKYFKDIECFDGDEDDYLEKVFHITETSTSGDSLKYGVDVLIKRKWHKKLNYKFSRGEEINHLDLGVHPVEITREEFNDLVNETIRFAEELKK